MINNFRKKQSAKIQQTLISRIIANDTNTFHIKWAETREEVMDSFRLVYDEYERAGYIKERKPSRTLLDIHHLLSDTVVLLMLENHRVVSTLSLIFDSEKSGLPMDSIYRNELEDLRKNNRKVVEGCALATSANYQSTNIFLYLFRQAYWYAFHSGANDICIMVNPKHVGFYRRILLFEELGVEKYYPRVGAPAVALKLDVMKYEEKLKSIHNSYPSKYSLYNFFYGKHFLSLKTLISSFDMDGHKREDVTIVRHFFNALSPEQKRTYPEDSSISSL